MKALILAAGFGTRLKPITDVIPKPLIPILNTPVIEYNINFLKFHGIKDIYINIHHHSEQIKDVLGNGTRFGVSITYLQEQEILGTGGAIASLKGIIDETFVVINSDTIFDFSLESMIDFHNERKSMATIAVVPAPNSDVRSVVTVNDDGVVTRMRDSSFFSPLPEGNSIFIGVHVIEPKLLEYIPSEIFTSITANIYAGIVADRNTISAYAINGRWWDMGTVESYLKCNFELIDLLPLTYFNPMEKYQNCPLDMNRNSLVVIGENGVLPAVPINPPVIVGNRVIIKSSNDLGPNLIIGTGSKVNSSQNLKNSIFLSGAGNDRVIDSKSGTIYY